MEYLIGKVLGAPIVDQNTGEVIANYGQQITMDLYNKIKTLGIKEVKTLHINDIECGPYIADTLAADPTKNQLEALVEIYRIMRPGEPPTQEAAESLFENLFFSEERYDLSPVGRMKFNQHIGRQEITGPEVLSKEDIVAVLKF